MNRRQKIIISVTGIFIVLLILIGLTYAYFLTRITGNGNPTSISVTTANLELVYGDGTTAILTSETPLMPSSTPIGTKDFTVTNNGDDSSYVVVFEDITVKYAENTVINGESVAKDTPTTFESNDFVYTLTCIVKDKNGNTLNDKTCDGVENETFPMNGGIVIGNNIDKDDVHSYILTLYYLDNRLNQSADMNKTLNGKVNIKDIKSINPYSENTSSLAYNIINNSKLNKNGTELVATPPSKVAKEINLETEKVLSVTIDDYGNSFYYRGNVTDNYVNFAGMCWRIVRIDGLGNTKLILEDQYAECDDTEDNDKHNDGIVYTGAWDIPSSDGIDLTIDPDTNEPYRTGNFGYKILDFDEVTRRVASYLNPMDNSNRAMVNAFKYFQNNNLSGYTSKLAPGNWCYNDIAYNDEIGTNIIDKESYYDSRTEFYYDSYVRLVNNDNTVKRPSLKCNGTVMNKYNDNTNMLVSSLTADEIMYAGGEYNNENISYYLLNTYQFDNSLGFWLLAPLNFNNRNDFTFLGGYDGYVDYQSVHSRDSFRPAIVLADNTEITGGTGIQDDPYVIAVI